MFSELLKDQSGASIAEYALLLALLAVASVGALTVLKNEIIAVFDHVGDSVGQH